MKSDEEHLFRGYSSMRLRAARLIREPAGSQAQGTTSAGGMGLYALPIYANNGLGVEEAGGGG